MSASFRVFEGFHRHNGGAQQLHAEHIGRLTLDVLGAHVHHAFHAVAGGHGGGGHAVLAGTGFGDHPLLAHALGQQRLANGVVDLVRPGVVEVFALEVDLRAAAGFAEPAGVVNRAGAANVVLEFVLVFGQKVWVVFIAGVFALQFVQRSHQGFGHISAAVAPKVALCVGKVIRMHSELLQ